MPTTETKTPSKKDYSDCLVVVSRFDPPQFSKTWRNHRKVDKCNAIYEMYQELGHKQPVLVNKTMLDRMFQ
ncbi:hypothetical protein TNCT_691521 [Trichonephila clavata]|uniref:Uncharacterized protein n=1 Tax=Trichonephila clavata TaxID=2740835 RepID=A0A8X6HAN8_TRICU|nr:hypothetical protein TNCT_691521 [Trichonephila clavata]